MKHAADSQSTDNHREIRRKCKVVTLETTTSSWKIKKKKVYGEEPKESGRDSAIRKYSTELRPTGHRIIIVVHA